MRRRERHRLAREGHAFLHREMRVGGGDDVLVDHAAQNLVAALERGDGVAVGALLHRRLRQRDQQRGFGQIDALGSLPK